MEIRHRMTVTVNKGQITVLEIIEDNGAESAITIMPSKHSAPVTHGDMESIENALDRERIISRSDFLTTEIAESIEEPLLNWLSAAREIEYRHIRWETDEMVGLRTKEEASIYDQERSKRAEDIQRKPSKTRIMMG